MGPTHALQGPQHRIRVLSQVRSPLQRPFMLTCTQRCSEHLRPLVDIANPRSRIKMGWHCDATILYFWKLDKDILTLAE